MFVKTWCTIHLNWIELFFLANLLVFAICTLYLVANNTRTESQDILVLLAVGSAIISCIYIFSFACFEWVKQKPSIKKLLKPNRVRKIDEDDILTSSHQSAPKVTTTVVELVEPLLQSDEDENLRGAV